MNIVASSFTQGNVKARNMEMENHCDVMGKLNTW
jgi:hypothetical protein